MEEKAHADVTDDMLPPSKGLTSEEAAAALIKYGPNEITEKKMPSWLVFLNCLWGPMPIALWLAAFIELALGNIADGFILLFIQFSNATIAWYETIKASDAVAALAKGLLKSATIQRDGRWQNIESKLVVPGDLVKLANGSAIPADCSINEGQIDVDQSALTGESMAVTMGHESVCKMGSSVVRGEVEGTVQFTGMRTFLGRSAALIQTVASGLGNIQKILLTVTIVLTSASVFLCTIAFIYLMASGETFAESLDFTVVLLIVSIPLAIEIVVTTTLAVGSHHLSQRQVIVKRLSAIEELAAVNMLCSDKTGTLTQNKMAIQPDCPVFRDGENLESTLVYAALAAKWREPPRDALDTMVLGAANLDKCDQYTQLDFIPFDAARKRTEATLKDKSGKTFKVTKGAPHIILNMAANKDAIQKKVEEVIHSYGVRGIRCLAVSRTYDDDTQFHMTGILTFLDPPRVDSAEVIRKAKEFGIGVKMITGDHVLIAREMARMLGMGDNVLDGNSLPTFDNDKVPDDLGVRYGDQILACDGFAQVLPEHKYLIVETLRQRGYVCAMTGDGVNDAAALKRADVGVAVEGATDVAAAASDMVLTREGLSVIIEAVIIARGIFMRMVSFLTYRVAATIQLLTFFFIALFSLVPCHFEGGYDPNMACEASEGMRFFRRPVLMLMLITLLNDGTLMCIGYDNVFDSPKPSRWNLPALFFVATVMAMVACLSSLLLLGAGLDSMPPCGTQGIPCPPRPGPPLTCTNTNRTSCTLNANGTYTVYTKVCPVPATPAPAVPRRFQTLADDANSTNNTCKATGLEYAVPKFNDEASECYTDRCAAWHGPPCGKDVMPFLVQNSTLVNSRTWCALQCRNAGYPIAGVEFSTLCFCSTRMPTSSKMAKDQCSSMPCPGNSSERCGGTDIISVFPSECAADFTPSPVTPAPPNTPAPTPAPATVTPNTPAPDIVTPSPATTVAPTPTPTLEPGCSWSAPAVLPAYTAPYDGPVENGPARTGSAFAAFGLPSMPYKQVITMMYLKVSVSDFLTLFSSRTQNRWFFSHMPSWVLIGGASLALMISTIVACAWPDGNVDKMEVQGLGQGAYKAWAVLVWLYCIFWWFVQDAIKVGTFYLMDRFDWFSYRSMAESTAYDAPKPKPLANTEPVVPDKELSLIKAGDKEEDASSAAKAKQRAASRHRTHSILRASETSFVPGQGGQLSQSLEAPAVVKEGARVRGQSMLKMKRPDNVGPQSIPADTAIF